MTRSRKKDVILYCEWCGKPLRPEREEPVDHGKMKVCQACHIDLNWFKSEKHGDSRGFSRARTKVIARVND